ncbi:MAG: prepilin-type N-terminal cleavage/methylation domain-containing protein [Verrucomicrobia bacterium]|nr:prepilin-type N-terminal cleavage/methylation domain-containing protein [Verrucomicrobiota bacterium]
MKNNSNRRAAQAFTLIELLVVIAIMGLLAGMVVALMPLATAGPKIKKTQAERDAIITSIEAYKAKKGFYPPDNPTNAALNQLYYELVGTTNNGTLFVTLSGKDSIQSSVMQAQFGVANFNNSTKAAKGSDDFDVQNFHKSLKQEIQTKVVPPGVRILVAPVDGPNRQRTNAWRYVSSNPTNNPGSFDLWADIVVGGKTNRISNWSKDPIIIGN